MKMKSPLTDFASNNAQRKKKAGTREEKLKPSPVNNEIQKFEGITYNPDLMDDYQMTTPQKN